MADGLDVPSFGNFAIDDSSMGNQEVLDTFFSPESATTDPDKIEKIVDESKPVLQKKKAIKAGEKEEEIEESTKPPAKKQEIIDPLSEIKDEDEEEEEEEPIQQTKKKIVSEEAPTDEEETEEVEETNTFKVLSKELFKLNVFTADEGEEDVEISTPEEFLERFNYEKKKGAIETVQNFIGQFGEDYQRAFDAIYVNGVNPKEYFSTFNKIEDIQSLDLSLETNQESVVRQGLLDQGMEEDDISAKLQKIKDYGDLEEESQRFHKVLVKKEALKLDNLQKESEKRLQQENAYKQQYIQNVTNVLQEKIKTKEFDGIPLNSALANELQGFLLVDKYKTPSGEKLTEFDRFILDLKKPENHAMKVKVALLLKTLEKDPSLSTIQKTGLSKKANSLFDDLARQKVKSTSSSKSGKASGPSAFSIL